MSDSHRQKSPPNAFLPTPNDALHPPSSESGCTSSLSTPSFTMITPSDRAFPCTASRLPSISFPEALRSGSPTRTAVPANHESWYDLCQKQQGLFAQREKMNDLERRLLHEEIAKLKRELMIERTKNQQMNLTLDDFRRGRGSLNSPSSSRQSSIGLDTRTIPGKSDLPSLETAHDPGRGFGNGPLRLPSVSEENESPAKPTRVFSESGAKEVNGNSETPQLRFGAATIDEVSPYTNSTPKGMDREPPLSPQSTIVPSPPPPRYRAHAGHTPIKPGVALSSTGTPGPGTDTPTQENTLQNQEIPVPDGPEEDPPLRGPLALPSRPDDEDTTIISAIDAKLNEVVEHPQHATPTVLQGSPGESSTVSDALPRPDEVERDDYQSPPDAPSAKSPDAPAATGGGREPVDGMPKLKMQRSMNFGAPLGSLRSH